MDREIKIAVLTVSDLPTAADDLAGNVIVDLARAAGHRIAALRVVACSESAIRKQLVKWISDPSIEIVIACGGELASRAVAPLITVRVDDELVRCASTRVYLLPSSIEGIAWAFDTIVLPHLAPAQIQLAPSAVVPPVVPPTVRDHRITTSSIATIGDLPVRDAGVDLRAGTKRGALFALASLSILAALTIGTTMTIAKHEAASAAPGPQDDVMTTIAAIAPPAALQKQIATPVLAPKPQVAPTPIAKPPVAPRRIRPTAPRPLSAPEVADDTVTEVASSCEETSCKLNDYERECCAPFRPTTTRLELNTVPAVLDRSMVATAIETMRPHVNQCGAQSDMHGAVRVAVEVGSDGRVASVVIQKTPDAGLGECVAARAHEATFPRTQDGGSFSYTFAF